MSNKFEKLLDYLVNEEMDKANDLFHEIVVEKSRQIYENLIAEEAEDDEEADESREEDDEEMDETRDEEDDEEMDESFGGDDTDSFVDNVEDDQAMGGDEFGNDEFGGGDEFGGDEFGDAGGDEFGGDEFGDADGSTEEPATKADIDELRDTIAQISSDIQSLVAGEKEEEEGNPDIHGGELDDLESDADADSEYDADADSEYDADADAEADDDEADEQFMREYKEIVGKPYGGGKVAGKTESEGTNKTSPISKASGRPSTTASAGNIAQSGKGEGKMDGTSSNAGPVSKSLVGGVKGEYTGNVLNRPGGNKGEIFKKNSAGHGAEKKGTGEGGGWGSGKGEKAGQTGSVNTKPIVDRKL